LQVDEEIRTEIP